MTGLGQLRLELPATSVSKRSTLDSYVQCKLVTKAPFEGSIHPVSLLSCPLRSQPVASHMGAAVPVWININPLPCFTGVVPALRFRNRLLRSGTSMLNT